MRTSTVDAEPEPIAIDPDATALLIIDMQRDFCAPGGYADRAGLDIAPLRGITANIKRLLDAARSADVTVIFTREGHLTE